MGHVRNYSIGDGFVGGDDFKEGSANDSPENISAVLELATLAKASLGNKTVFLHGYEDDPEKMAMHMYAAELAGLNVGNDGQEELSTEIKQKIDQAWNEMNNTSDPELTAELDQNIALEVNNEQQFSTPIV